MRPKAALAKLTLSAKIVCALVKVYSSWCGYLLKHDRRSMPDATTEHFACLTSNSKLTASPKPAYQRRMNQAGIMSS